MTEKEVQEILDELNTVRPEMLNESGKRLFEAIMKIADERDKANNIINELEKYLIEQVEKSWNNDYDNVLDELDKLKGNDK